jgi:cysteine desulfurase family protein
VIYFDNAATTYPKPESVYEALNKANREMAFNAGRGSYKKARELSAKIDETRSLLADIVKANKDNVILKTSSTSALNNIILGIDWKENDNIYVSPFEHNSVMRPLEHIKKQYHINIITLPFNKKTWEIEQEAWNLFALKKPKCVICSSKSNVTGYELPTKEIFREAKKYNSITILDASQSFGVDKTITKENTDFIIFAGHKSLYASFGIAGFLKLSKVELKTVEFGGTGSDSLNLNMPEEEPNKYESGSKNIVAILGLNESLKWLKNTNVKQKEEELTQYLYKQLKQIPKMIIYTPDNEKKCIGLLSINIEGYSAEEVGSILDEEFNIAVRTGYHCAPIVHDFINSKQYNGTVRISLNYFNTKEQIDTLIKALKSL